MGGRGGADMPKEAGKVRSVLTGKRGAAGLPKGAGAASSRTWTVDRRGKWAGEKWGVARGVSMQMGGAWRRAGLRR